MKVSISNMRLVSYTQQTRGNRNGLNLFSFSLFLSLSCPSLLTFSLTSLFHISLSPSLSFLFHHCLSNFLYHFHLSPSSFFSPSHNTSQSSWICICACTHVSATSTYTKACTYMHTYKQCHCAFAISALSMII